MKVKAYYSATPLRNEAQGNLIMESDISIFNYCDRRCERCLLTSKCKIALYEEENRKQHITNGENSDDMNVVLQDMSEMFALSFQMLEKMAKKAGIDLNNLPDIEEKKSPPICELSKNYAVEATKLIGNIKTNNTAIYHSIKEAVFCAQQISAKIHRIFAHPTQDNDLCREHDYLLLLLIEKIIGNYLCHLEKVLFVFPETIDLFSKEMNIKLMKQIYDLIQEIPQDARKFIEKKIDKKEAPSPFCVRN